MKLESSETLLIGKWLLEANQIVADNTCQRIEGLLESYLIELACDTSGWGGLYRDPYDGRLWELSYPDSELQGGGPPQLRLMALEEACQKYGK